MIGLKKKTLAGMLAGLVLASSGAVLAAGLFTNGVPQAGGTQYPTTLPLTGNELVPADTQLPSGLNPASEAISTTQLAGFGRSLSGSGGWRNSLIGGDFGTNPFQRGTTSASITTALLYGPDRWWGISGTGTAFTIIKETGASDILADYAASARVQRTASQTGVLPVCVGQVLTSADSTRYQGQLAEFVLHAKVGANYSAASSRATLTIATGTGADDSAANFSTGAWAGYTVVSAQTVALTTSFQRLSAVGTISAGATQIGVKLCYTPVGTAGANDWLEFTGAMLDVNPSAVAMTGVAGTAGSAASFERRPAAVEFQLAEGYFWRLAEPASTAAISASCQAVGATSNICNVNLPQQMRAIPTITITTAGTFKVNIAGTPTTIATPTASVCGLLSCAVTAGNTNTAGQAELLSGGGGSGAWDISAEL